ncbi:hypothetical protein [Paenibacillus silviterrae]|uniref:hypothetical protein n=1 Tax=Paenibacillus silviterrae TaxID=3242194 RepID=UPI0025433FA9|nr:hypothetical protein [Paenibacillus chinjuensis]
MSEKQSPATGEAVAAMYALLFGLALMLASHLWTLAEPFRAPQQLLKLGSWIPGWWGIGAYAGKETVGLLSWMLSWIFLHVLLHKRSCTLKPHFYIFMIGFVLLLVGYWPPVYHAVFGWTPTLP